MTETDWRMCRICLTTNKDDNISDSSSYAKFFIHLISLEKFDEKLWLCLWCRASLRRAVAVLTMALESIKAFENKVLSNMPRCPKRLYTLNYIHNPPIDIPPLIECQDNKKENIEYYSKEFTDSINTIQNEVETPLLRNIKCLKPNVMKLKENTIKESNDILNLEDNSHENEIEVTIGNKDKFNFSELKFEVEYLNLEEQLKEVEMKKMKYKDFKFQCNQCGMGYLTSDVFDEHKIRHSELNGPHNCSICSLHFKSQEVLSQHNLAHRRRFKCTLCSGVFKRWSHCIAHRYKCGGVVEPTACGVCDKIFSNEYSLKIHMKVHKTEKKYCCEQCDRKFASKQRLTVHIRTHSGVKPFSCEVCGRSFSTRSNLRAHSAAHEHTSHHYCVECHTYYKTAKSLKRHFNESAKHVAAKNDLHSCNECSKQFSTEKLLNYHINARHGTEHRCTQCHKTFSNKSNLNKHIKCIHTVK